MASFEIAFSRTVRVEGGYSSTPKDPGNYNSRKELVGTNHGITANTYQDAFKKVPTKTDMLRLTVAQAKSIYKKLYWNPIKGDLIADQNIANLVFDHGVNTNPRKAVVLLNAAMAAFKQHVSGNVLDAAKLAILNKLPGKELFDIFKAARIAYYKKHSKPVFLTGLINRVKKFSYV